MFETYKKRLWRWVAFKLEEALEPFIEDRVNRAIHIQKQVEEFKRSPETDKASYWESRFDAELLSSRLKAAKIEVEDVSIDIPDFLRWMEEFPSLCQFYEGMQDVYIEKVLEHYLSYTLLEISKETSVIDIAAEGSPFAANLRRKGLRAWRLDKEYPPGIRNWDIGADASQIPLEDNFADILLLQCAFECFQGDSDREFTGEASRILKPGGRLGILPLYLDTIYFVKTSPHCDKREIDTDSETRWLWRDDSLRAPFSRHYSPEAFSERIVSNMTNFTTKVLRFTNLEEVKSHFPSQRIYCHFMFIGEKR